MTAAMSKLVVGILFIGAAWCGFNFEKYRVVRDAMIGDDDREFQLIISMLDETGGIDGIWDGFTKNVTDTFAKHLQNVPNLV